MTRKSPARPTTAELLADSLRPIELNRSATYRRTIKMRINTSSVNRALLACGAVSGPLFIVAIMVQAAINPGFDLRTDLISLLSIGPYGYLQIGNFALCGLLCVLF